MDQVVGRYAPSPTGALHLGNLRTALIAWLHARFQGGQFLLRMEDLDLPRVVPGSADNILKDLEWLGIDWDGDVVYQSQRQDLYQTSLEALQDANQIYPCFCSRKEIRQAASAPHGSSTPYPGTCAGLSNKEIALKQQTKPPALRVRVHSNHIKHTDGILGAQQQSLAIAIGDFVVKRADDLFAYQFAVVVDDLEQGVSHVVRGADLADSSARQLFLAKQLAPEAEPIEYWHVPLLLDEHGKRMAKRDGSASADEWRAAGKNALQMVGEFAFQLGLLAHPEPVTPKDLVKHFTIQQLTIGLSALHHQALYE